MTVRKRTEKSSSLRRPASATGSPDGRQATRADALPALVKASRQFAGQVDSLAFSPPVRYVYNPLIYAREPHEKYLSAYGQGLKSVLFVGMNPGPWGMVQTGVPFGEVDIVKEWLGLEGKVDQPPRLHPKRPVEGFACKRHEPSGKRLWGLMRARFKTPQVFFQEHFIANYCPLAFFDGEGKNITPDKLPLAERLSLLTSCDLFLRETIRLLQPRFVIGVGQFALNQVNETIKLLKQLPAGEQAALRFPPDAIITGKILHPSPANPTANSGWAEQAAKQLADLGVWA